MFKKLLPTVAILLLAFSVLQVSIARVCFGIRPTLAAAKLKLSVPPLAQPTPTPTSKPEINYYLVYPGMLPDQALYKLKMVRDRIWILITTNPVKKAELLLLFADKRLGAARVLIEGNKVPLGINTLVKGEKYLERSVNQTIDNKKNGENISVLAGKLRLAIQKHQEVLLELQEKVSSEGKTVFDGELKLLRILQEKAQTL